jgi:tetratricopeptide (TPR) repeat protein
MRARALLRDGACALFLTLVVVACSTAPAKSDTVTTMKTQATQNAAFGDGYYRQGRFDLALQFYLQALNEYTSVDDVEGIVLTYNDIGMTYIAMGSYDAAEPLLLKAQDTARSVSQPLLLTSSINLGELYLAKGDATKALATFQEGLNLPAKARTPMNTAILYHDTGTAQKSLGDLSAALASFGKSLEINLANKYIQEAAGDYYMIASVYSKQGSYDEATKNALLALAADKQIESSPGIAHDLYALGLIAAKKPDMASAYDYFQRAYLVYTTLGAKADIKKALTELISTADALNRTTEATGYRKTLSDLGAS